MSDGDYGSPANRQVVLDPKVHYVCQRCTACCKWPGDVRLEEDELQPEEEEEPRPEELLPVENIGQ